MPTNDLPDPERLPRAAMGMAGAAMTVHRILIRSLIGVGALRGPALVAELQASIASLEKSRKTADPEQAAVFDFMLVDLKSLVSEIQSPPLSTKPS